jgi:hypothetical protein
LILKAPYIHDPLDEDAVGLPPQLKNVPLMTFMEDVKARIRVSVDCIMKPIYVVNVCHLLSNKIIIMKGQKFLFCVDESNFSRPGVFELESLSIDLSMFPINR